MGLFGTGKPNVSALLRRGDVDGLVQAATFQDLIPSGDGGTADRGVPVREEAILALGALAGDAGNGTVAAALTDASDRVRVAAVRVLYAQGDGERLAEALGWLPARRGHSRRLALHAIAELRLPESARTVVRALVHARGDEPLSDEEVELVDTLLRCGQDAEPKDAVTDELVSALASERVEVADRAEELLARLMPGAVDSLLAELKGGAGAPRAAALLGRIKDSRALEPLVEALEHRDPRVRAESARALGELRDPAGVESLMRATRDPDHTVRAQAGWALDHIGAVAVMVGVSYLMRPMIHEAVRAAAAEHLGPAGQRHSLPDATHSEAGRERANGHERTNEASADRLDSNVLRRLARLIDRVEDSPGGEFDEK